MHARFEHLISLAIQTNVLLLLTGTVVTARHVYDWVHAPESHTLDASMTRRRWSGYLAVLGLGRAVCLFFLAAWDRPLLQRAAVDAAPPRIIYDIQQRGRSGSADSAIGARACRSLLAWVCCLHRQAPHVCDNEPSTRNTPRSFVSVVEAQRIRHAFVRRWRWSESVSLLVDLGMLLVPTRLTLVVVAIAVVLHLYVLSSLGSAEEANSAWFVATDEYSTLHHGYHIMDVPAARARLCRSTLPVLFLLLFITGGIHLPIFHYTPWAGLLEPARVRLLRADDSQVTPGMDNATHTSLRGFARPSVWVVNWEGVPCGFETLPFAHSCPDEYRLWNVATTNTSHTALRENDTLPWPTPHGARCLVGSGGTSGGAGVARNTLVSGHPTWTTGGALFAGAREPGKTPARPLGSLSGALPSPVNSVWESDGRQVRVSRSPDIPAARTVASLAALAAPATRPGTGKGLHAGLAELDAWWLQELLWLRSAAAAAHTARSSSVGALLVTHVRTAPVCTTLPHLFHRLHWLLQHVPLRGSVHEGTANGLTLVVTSSHGQLVARSRLESAPPAGSYGGGTRDVLYTPYLWWSAEPTVRDLLQEPPLAREVAAHRRPSLHSVRATVDVLRGVGVPRDTLGSPAWPLVGSNRSATQPTSRDRTRRCRILREVLLGHGINLEDIPPEADCHGANPPSLEAAWVSDKETQPAMQVARNLLIALAGSGVCGLVLRTATATSSLATPRVLVDWLVTRYMRVNRLTEIVPKGYASFEATHPAHPVHLDYTIHSKVVRYNAVACLLALASGVVPTAISAGLVVGVFYTLGWYTIDGSVFRFTPGVDGSPALAAVPLFGLLVQLLPVVVYVCSSALFRLLKWHTLASTFTTSALMDSVDPVNNRPHTYIHLGEAMWYLVLPYQVMCCLACFSTTLAVHAFVSSALPWVWPSWFLQRSPAAHRLHLWTSFLFWCWVPWVVDIALNLARRAWPLSIISQRTHTTTRVLYAHKRAYLVGYGVWREHSDRVGRWISYSARSASRVMEQDISTQ
jgi:hypothetical protein